MSDIAIRVENLSKQYKIGSTIRHDRLKDLLAYGLSRLLSENSKSKSRNSQSDYIWALKDVSFEVKYGETLGIIGANGAGKSTLLKILSRITEPTCGRAEIYGRVGSLLEVGTGFDRELTGRENIYLNGAILGMTKREIDRKFDEIVDFSGVKQFIDTPIKRYSSGMYVRLAFAVAAHLEPEILIVDEVLAVGDLAFQRKCLGKMHDVAGLGRTVIFVSHNMEAIKSLCNRCLFLGKGEMLAEGPSDKVANYYIDQIIDGRRERHPRTIEADPGEEFLLHQVDDCEDITIRCGDPITVEFDIEATKPLPETEVGIVIVIATLSGKPIVSMGSLVQRVPTMSGPSRLWRVRCDMGRLPINAGTYLAGVFVVDELHSIGQFRNAMTIRIMEHDVFGWGKSLPSATYWGPMYWAPQWDIRPLE